MTRKLIALTDSKGNVLGTIAAHGHDKEGRSMQYRLHPHAGQSTHEIEVDDALLTKSADSVHAEVAKALRSRHP